MTYFTVMVADTTEDPPFPPYFEPGCCDPATGIVIAQSLYQIYHKTSLSDSFAEEIWMRYDFLDQAVEEMQEDYEGETPWWEKIPQPLSLKNSTRPLNLTLTKSRSSSGLAVAGM